MDLSASSLFSSLLVSTIGFALFLYGRKQGRPPHLIGGLVMMLYPYFVPGALLMIGLGALIAGAVWLAAKRGW
jgi:hypothetical protein